MNLKWNKVEKYLVYALVFLVPTQLAYHFWPSWSLIFGIRVDYLAPTIYLTDLIAFILICLFIRRDFSHLASTFKKQKKIIFIGFTLVLLNVLFATNSWISLLRWLKILEMVGIYLYFRVVMKKGINEKIFHVLFYSLIFFGLIGIGQFLIGHTIGGPFYFLGERSFDQSTPGIALTSFGGREVLRAYSTFSHPNSLAGYIGASLLLLISVNFFKKNLIHIIGFLLIIFAFLATSSLVAITSLICSLFLVLILGGKLPQLLQKGIIFLFVGLSLLSPFLGQKIDLGYQNSKLTERIELSLVSTNSIIKNPLTGVGLGNFINDIPGSGVFKGGPWLLQPVHNIFLLAFSETGILGLLILSFLLYKGLKTKFFPVFFFIILTGFFDHYWLTLQQNLLLLTLIFGVLH